MAVPPPGRKGGRACSYISFPSSLPHHHITSNPRRACSQASVGVNRKIFQGLNFPFRGFLGVEKFGRFFLSPDSSRAFGGIQNNNSKVGGSVHVSQPRSSAIKVKKIAHYIVSQNKYAPQSVLVCFQRGFISFSRFLIHRSHYTPGFIVTEMPFCRSEFSDSEC